MKYLFASICLLLALSSFAQCEYEKNGKDDFEDVEVVLTKDVKVVYPFSSYPIVYFALGRMDTVLFLKVKIVGTKVLCLNPESDLLLKMSDGKVYRLEGMNDANCSDVSKGVFTLPGVFRIDRAVLETLAGLEVEKFRLETTDGLLDVEIEKGNVNKKKGARYFRDFKACVDL